MEIFYLIGVILSILVGFLVLKAAFKELTYIDFFITLILGFFSWFGIFMSCLFYYGNQAVYEGRTMLTERQFNRLISACFDSIKTTDSESAAKAMLYNKLEELGIEIL